MSKQFELIEEDRNITIEQYVDMLRAYVVANVSTQYELYERMIAIAYTKKGLYAVALKKFTEHLRDPAKINFSLKGVLSSTAFEIREVEFLMKENLLNRERERELFRQMHDRNKKDRSQRKNFRL